MTHSPERRQFVAAGIAPVAFLALRRPSLPDALANGFGARANGLQVPSRAFLATLPRLMEVAGVPGAGIAFVQDGKTVWQRHLGVMDATTQQPVTAATLWPAASLSKPVFAHAALHLADEGKLDLDKPLKAYVPDHAPADPRGDKITARHVLSHSSGLRNWRNRPDQPLIPDFEPGSRFQYSGEGYYYLLRAVEHITGMGFEQFMQERLLGPLGMTMSSYIWRSDSATRLVTGHSQGRAAGNFSADLSARLLAYAVQHGRSLASYTSEEVAAAMAQLTPAPPILPNYMIPNSASSLLTTPADYAAFVIALLGNAPRAVALAPSTRDLMLTSQTPINSALSWGLGIGQELHAGERFVWHWGDNGNWKNFVLAHPGSKSALVIFTNGSNGLHIANRVVAAASDSEHEAFLWL